MIDDGSTEAGYADLKTHYHGESSVIIYQYKSNGGSPRCYNKGIELVTGDYVSFLGDDDEFCPDRFVAAQRILSGDNTVDVVIENVYSYDYTLSERVAEKDIVVPTNMRGNIFSLLVATNRYHLSLEGMTIRRSLLTDTKFDERLTISQDTDFIWELCRYTTIKGSGYSHSYVKRRIHNTNITKDYQTFHRCREILYQKWFKKSLIEDDLKDYRLIFFRHYAHWKAINRKGLKASYCDKAAAYRDVVYEIFTSRLK